MVSQRAETSATPQSPTDIEMENAVAESPTPQSPTDIEMENAVAESPTPQSPTDIEMENEVAESPTPQSPTDIEMENAVAESPTPQSPTDLEVENDESERQSTFEKTKKFIQRHSKLLQLLVFLTKETVDTTLDWLLFNELNTQGEGLIFGAVDKSLLYVLFIFCCIGTMLTFLDISNRVHELRTGNPFINAVIPEFLTVLLEDFPQLSIGYHILLCRGQTINSIARVKAWFLLFGSFLYIFYTYIWYLILRKKDILGSWLKGVLLLPCIGIFFLAFFILVYTTGTGRNFDPFDILKQETERDQYFSRVGIYVNTGDLQTDDLKNTNDWIKIFEIYDILENDEISVQIMTDPSHIWLQTIYDRIQKNNTDICFRVNETFKGQIVFSEASDCVLSNGTTWYYRFKYVPPSMRYLLGDIQYNVRKTEIGSCDNIAVDRVPDLKYFRAGGNETLTGHLYGPDQFLHYEWGWGDNYFYWKRNFKLVYLYENAYKFYSAEEDLIDIKGGWKSIDRCMNIDVFLISTQTSECLVDYRG